jgi:DNA processing protein
MPMPRRPDQVSDAALAVLLAPGIGPVTIRRLLQRFGSFKAIASANASQLQTVQGIGAQTAHTLRRAFDDAAVDAERDAMHDHGASIVLVDDDDFPPLLKSIPAPPPALWVRGTLPPAHLPAVAIVGTRRCTTYGRDQTTRLATLLAENGLTIISGGALGIDAEAHRAALRVKAPTTAVLGCGLAHTYPPQHDELFARIVGEGGSIISEFPMEVPPLAAHFPRRNHTIAGLCAGVLVIEAPVRSGALITARIAVEELNREAMAIPGRVDSPTSRGCLLAIQDGWAAMVLNHADVIAQLESSSIVREISRHEAQTTNTDDDVTGPAAGEPSLFDHALSPTQQKIVDALRAADDAMLVDDLAARTQIPLSVMQADVTLLQIRGHIIRDTNGVRLGRRHATR